MSAILTTHATTQSMPKNSHVSRGALAQKRSPRPASLTLPLANTFEPFAEQTSSPMMGHDNSHAEGWERDPQQFEDAFNSIIPTYREEYL